MFKGFEKKHKRVNGVDICYRIGGEGPGLLLLHGHPQTHVIWHKIAEKLALSFTVVAADLRGYGDSGKPPATPDSRHYAKSVMAKDQVELMQAIGFNNFDVLAHDRGARVAYRMGLDYENNIGRMMLLDIAPTLAMYEQTTEAFARAYWHWFFLIRPAPFPESTIESDPEGYLRAVMSPRSAGMRPFTQAAFSEYLRCVSLPNAAVGLCEDYRASAGIDLLADRKDYNTGNKIQVPLSVLWSKDGPIGRYFSPLKEWQKVAINVQGKELPCGHYIPEEVPELLLENVEHFFIP
ncbi:MAG: alpha/beta fold hydrolase [Sphingomonadales bacterium]